MVARGRIATSCPIANNVEYIDRGPVCLPKVSLVYGGSGPQLINVHVYSQRVQKYTKSSRTQNVKKNPCLH